jgi:hypothetical protein
VVYYLSDSRKGAGEGTSEEVKRASKKERRRAKKEKEREQKGKDAGSASDPAPRLAEQGIFHCKSYQPF